jgi:2-C-methyl-D-erythritol 4-phosphate cytidylyltransferase / 2-C-methyl-D-erythritol 2,4-cyclodiphosphate synthase
LPDLTLVMLSAGSSSRFHHKAKKQWLRIGDVPLWLYSTHNLANLYPFSKIIVTMSREDLPYARKFSDTITFVEGGDSRQASLKNALLHVSTPYVLISDCARPCIDASMLERILNAALTHDCVVPYLSVVDTVVYEEATIERADVKLIQTPQCSSTALLKQALQTDVEYTDESSAIKAIGGHVAYVLGNAHAKKLTCKDDIPLLPCLEAPTFLPMVGYGFDVHAFMEGKAMMLGGVEVHPSMGFRAHSDGDVAIHALIDALLGAAGAGDIGECFPDSEARYKDIDSKELLSDVCAFLERVGFEMVHCDITIMAEFPKLGHMKDAIRFALSKVLHLPPHHINIKATTTEKLGFVGRKEGVAVSATATLKYLDWKNA